ncbi:hypothetical protein [Legionella spiritensis]|uniref:hypothetical protein n=1 Tax=Legionella spiritensis TaxID=452 RepID=UPI000F70EC58|nr:hypothetical protein [Legionella spiritensis]VEG90800.1 Uncharacterised protein [Legionella spiritensis]
MRVYNEDEALLQAWKKKLEKIETSHDDLRNRFLAILEQEHASVYKRKTEFYQLKNKLTSDEHGQGFSWTPHFQWFWNLLSFFLPTSWLNSIQPKGSRLRQALEEKPVFSTELLTLEKNEHGNIAVEKLDDEQFEAALFDVPEQARKALHDAANRLNDLTPECDEETVTNLIERVYALKSRLDPLSYQRLLVPLYQHHPRTTLAFFYEQYRQDQKSIPDEQDFIEQHLMAKAMMDQWVCSSPDINIHRHNIHYLLIFLTLSQYDTFHPNLLHKSYRDYQSRNKSLIPEDFIRHLLTEWVHEGKARVNFSASYKIIKDALENAFPDEFLEEKRRHSSGDPFANPLTMLRFIFTRLLPQDKSSKHRAMTDQPLMVHIAREACTRLLLDYEQSSDDPIWKTSSAGSETMKLLSDDILATWLPNFALTNDRTIRHELLNPDRISSIPPSFKRPEDVVRRITFPSAQDGFDPVIAARHYRSQINPAFMTESIEWILLRIKETRPYLDEKRLRHILADTKFFDEKDLPPVMDKARLTDPVDILIKNIRAGLEKAREQREAFDAPSENESVQQAVHSFHDLLHHPDFDGDALGKAYSILAELRTHYLTDRLHKQWEKIILDKQARRCLWDQKQLESSGRESLSIKEIQDTLDEARVGHNHDLNKEYKSAKQAVLAFARLMEDDSLDDASLNQACQIVQTLKFYYISNELYEQWSDDIQNKQKTRCTWDQARISEECIETDKSSRLLLSCAKDNVLKAQSSNYTDLDKEYDYAKQAVLAFAGFMENGLSGSSFVGEAHQILQTLRQHYITDELYGQWNSIILSTQKTRCTWDQKDILNKPAGKGISIADALSLVKSSILKAEANNNTNLNQEYEESAQAVLIFALLIETLKEPSASTTDIADTRDTLDKLRPYLTQNLYDQWAEELDTLAKKERVVSGKLVSPSRTMGSFYPDVPSYTGTSHNKSTALDNNVPFSENALIL